MAVRYLGIPSANLVQLQGSSVVGASSGGTLAGAQGVQLVFDDTIFDATVEGKQRLIAAMQIIEARLMSARSYPIDSTS
jgi:hypothetical protein